MGVRHNHNVWQFMCSDPSPLQTMRRIFADVGCLTRTSGRACRGHSLPLSVDMHAVCALPGALYHVRNRRIQCARARSSIPVFLAFRSSRNMSFANSDRLMSTSRGRCPFNNYCDAALSSTSVLVSSWRPRGHRLQVCTPGRTIGNLQHGKDPSGRRRVGRRNGFGLPTACEPVS
ncbi:hypothetical protein BD413DRAFT_210078 [Trametes elegans]|nr:hypothetical protein BD413DRAFT_210078 [Trametes elegans]